MKGVKKTRGTDKLVEKKGRAKAKRDGGGVLEFAVVWYSSCHNPQCYIGTVPTALVFQNEVFFAMIHVLFFRPDDILSCVLLNPAM